MSKPLVSICMITYNHEDYIVDAIRGILNQVVTFDFELIVSDDCSTDKTSEKALEFIGEHPQGAKV